MGDLKFVPQSMLDVWADLGKIELEGNVLRIPQERASFSLTPAIRFLSLLEGEDRHKLLAKVKTEQYVREIGGEVVTDSCLVGETAYQVQPGFLAEVEALAAAQTAKATRKLAPKPAAPAPAPRPAPAPAPVPAILAAAARPLPSAASTPVPASGQQSPPAPSRSDDADLLTQFLLESLD